MPNFSQQRLMPYSRNQVFDMVADVKSYPEFLPWCFAARVKHHHKELFEANLVVGFQLLRENFTSFVVLNRSEYSICVEHTKGPFKHLINRWNFNEDEMG